MKKRYLPILVFLLIAVRVDAFESVRSVCYMPESLSAQVRVFNATTQQEDVAWTNVGVTERSVGLSKSCYHYTASLVAGNAYQIDWRDSSSPLYLASETISETETRIDSLISSRSSHSASDVTGGTTVAQAETNLRGLDGDTLKILSDEIANVQSDLDNPTQYWSDLTGISTSVQAVKDQTDQIVFVNGKVDANATASVDEAAIAAAVDAVLGASHGAGSWTTANSVTLTAGGIDAILDEPVEGAYTMRQMLRLIASSLFGKASGGGTTTITFRNLGDTKTRIQATVDDKGNRTAVILDGD